MDDVSIPFIPAGMQVPAELPEEQIMRQLYEQKNQLLLKAHTEARRKKALADAYAVRAQIKDLGAEPCM